MIAFPRRFAMSKVLLRLSLGCLAAACGMGAFVTVAAQAQTASSLNAQTETPRHSKPVLQIRPKSSPAPAPSAIVKKPAFIPDPNATTALPVGLPLRVEIVHRYALRLGNTVEGKLIEPVYVGDHIVLPTGARVFGRVSRRVPVSKSDRTWALLNGDFTPLKKPEVVFNSIEVPAATKATTSQRYVISAHGIERTAKVVKMAAKPKKEPTKWQQAKGVVKLGESKVGEVVHHPAKREVAERFIYGQLPYHPQEIWTGTQFDAELTAPVTLSDPITRPPLPILPAKGSVPAGLIEARLTTKLNSATNKVGDPAEAVLTQPYLNATGDKVILPTGTRLIGTVQQSMPAHMWGRNGTLRFSFHQVVLPTGTLAGVQSQMTRVEGMNGQNVHVDSEGGAHSSSGVGKVMAPLALSLLAGHSFDPDLSAVSAGASSNGFGLFTNLSALILDNRPMVEGFAFYALGKSLTRRWILPGHQVDFAKDTRLQMEIAGN